MGRPHSGPSMLLLKGWRPDLGMGERSPGALAQFVQFVLQGVDLALYLVKERSFRGDEHAAGGIDNTVLNGDWEPCGREYVSGVDVQLKGADPVHHHLLAHRAGR